MKKKAIIGIVAMFVFLTLLVIYIPFCQSLNLRSLESEVANISLPAGIERIAIKSAIGDSGGNGEYSTLRVVLLVKTDLNIDELKETIENIDLHFPKHYKSRNNAPIFYVTYCNSSTFQSLRVFMLNFAELEEIIDYSNYYFIEFVE